MPNRMLRDWTQSDKVNLLSCEAERFFTRLIMKVDDYGSFYADTRLLRANLFPLKMDIVQDADISNWLIECKESGLIITYKHDSKDYLHIIDFGQRLDRARSKYPLPDGSENQLGGYVYLVDCEKEKTTKIGFSRNPWARAKEIKATSGETVALSMVFVGTTSDEKELHKLLKPYNYVGEWFKLPENIKLCFSECLEKKLSAIDVIVVLRRNSSPPEVEQNRSRSRTEVEPGERFLGNIRNPIIPTKEEVEAKFISCGGTKEMADRFFAKHSATDWYLNGSPIRKFSSLVNGFIASWRENRKETTTDQKIKLKFK